MAGTSFAMTRSYHSPTLTELHHAVTRPLFVNRADNVDEANSVDVQHHNVIAYAGSLAWEFDLRDLWLTPGRWTTMVRQYVPPDQLLIWLDTCENKIGRSKRGIAMLRTNTVPPKVQSNGKITRRWGSCMLAISYKAVPRPTITLHSRTTYLGYIGALDLTVAHVCGRYVAEVTDQAVEDISFVWMNEAVQWHGFKSLAYLFTYEPTYAKLCETRRLKPKHERYVQERPGLLIARKWLQKVRAEYEDEGRSYGDEKYNTYLRIIRRYHTEVRGYDFARQFESEAVNRTEQGKIKRAYKPLPSTPASSLDFRKLREVPPLGDTVTLPPDDLLETLEDI